MFPFLFQLLEASYIPWLTSTFSIYKVSYAGRILRSDQSELPLPLVPDSFPLLRALEITLGPPGESRIIPYFKVS